MEQPPVKKIVKKIIKVIKKVPVKSPAGGIPAPAPVRPAPNAPAAMVRRPVAPPQSPAPAVKKVIVKKKIIKRVVRPASTSPEHTFVGRVASPPPPPPPVMPRPPQPVYQAPEPEEYYEEPEVEENYYEESEVEDAEIDEYEDASDYYEEDEADDEYEEDGYDEDDILEDALDEDDDDDIDMSEFDEFVKSMEPDYDKIFNDFMAQNFLEESGDEEPADIDYFADDAPEITPEKVAEAERQIIASLKPEEGRLFKALKSLEANIEKIADYNGYEMPNFVLRPLDLYTRLRKHSLKKARKDIFVAWAMLSEVYSNELRYLSGREGEEELMAIAERTEDGLLKDAIINYLLVMVEVEACKVRDESIKLKYEKLQASKEVIEKKKEAQHRKEAFIKKIKSYKLPIDAEKLVNNYFKMAKRDPDKAYRLLTTNPAMFAPIDFSKMPKGFLGAKPKPQDGIKMNKKIGAILKTIKA